jgi:hypothetical protein
MDPRVSERKTLARFTLNMLPIFSIPSIPGTLKLETPLSRPATTIEPLQFWMHPLPWHELFATHALLVPGDRSAGHESRYETGAFRPDPVPWGMHVGSPATQARPMLGTRHASVPGDRESSPLIAHARLPERRGTQNSGGVCWWTGRAQATRGAKGARAQLPPVGHGQPAFRTRPEGLQETRSVGQHTPFAPLLSLWYQLEGGQRLQEQQHYPEGHAPRSQATATGPLSSEIGQGSLQPMYGASSYPPSGFPMRTGSEVATQNVPQAFGAGREGKHELQYGERAAMDRKTPFSRSELGSRYLSPC